MGRVDGKVALITGAARGQGRSHALRLAQEGADIVAIDICAPIASACHSGATPEDLATTVAMVEDLDRGIIARQGDVRDSAALKSLVDDAVAELGHIDIVCANAGIAGYSLARELSDEDWQEMIDINLTGVWKTAKAVLPHMVERGQGGSIILTSSVTGMAAYPNTVHYAAAKHGVVGITRALAVELAPHHIRVNTINPTTVDTKMIDSQPMRDLFIPDAETPPTKEDVSEVMKQLNALPIPWVDAVDISNAVLFLASDEARYITGIQMPVDAGSLMPYRQAHV